MSASVLVTGGAGYIGSHACKALSRAGFRPIVYDNLVNGHAEAVRWGPLVEGDLADAGRLRAVMSAERVRCVMHFAAYAYVGESMEKPADYFHNNVVNTVTLLDAMRDVGADTIVFSSTCATYGKPNRVPVVEEHPQVPVSPYGESKLMAERLLAWYGQAYGIHHANLRYFNAAGADPDGEIGEDHKPETHLIPLAIQAALGQGPALQLFGTDWPTPDGSCIRDFIHVSDLADAHVLALRHLLTEGGSFNVNLGTGTGHSVHEVIRTVERFTGLGVPLVRAPRRAGDPPVLVADAGKALGLLGWRPLRSDLDSIVETALGWHSRRVVPPRAAAVR
ncbi:MAG: UDP-glucose 4-epimerase GalE [Proteobacteria bacterium]|nr:UDP-glucose 4-epimerase GalE [Pseudomonadota bacterium]MBI3497723.1 UDP-glucose 4-epimerase GalE [Pseudomonadota bacterium]